MASLIHEVWEDMDEDGQSLPGCCLAGPDGEGFRALLSSNAILLITFEASCHFEAMNNYYEIVGYGKYRTEHQSDTEPYPQEWALRQGNNNAT